MHSLLSFVPTSTSGAGHLLSLGAPPSCSVLGYRDQPTPVGWDGTNPGSSLLPSARGSLAIFLGGYANKSGGRACLPGGVWAALSWGCRQGEDAADGIPRPPSAPDMVPVPPVVPCVPLPYPSAPPVPLPVPVLPRGMRTVAASAVPAWLEVAEPRQPPCCQP